MRRGNARKKQSDDEGPKLRGDNIRDEGETERRRVQCRTKKNRTGRNKGEEKMIF